ncbi:MAG: DUF2312 domain-containing protein [Sphingobacteriia bacterium]|nr:DUF2312 domain-containing protein [Sphingobacteriia bacterium]
MSDAYMVSADLLKQYVARIERMEEEKANVLNDIKEIYAEAKSNGFDTKALKTIIKIRKKDQGELEEAQMVLETYMDALGMGQKVLAE